MKTAHYSHENGVSALYQNAGQRTPRELGLTHVSDAARDLGERRSVPDQWAVDQSPITKGERHYNRLINSTTYLGTFGASLAGAYFFKHTKTGVKLLDPYIARLTEFYAKKGFANPAKSADIAVTIGALMAGGTVPAIPFKMLEATRKDRIRDYNEKHGTGIDDPELRELAKLRIEQIPDQSITSAAAGRLSAMGLTLAFGIFIPATANFIEKNQLKLAEALSNSPLSVGKLAFRDRMAAQLPIEGTEACNAAERFMINGKELDKYMVVDGTWSAFTAGVLLLGSRAAAALGFEKEDHKNVNSNVSEIEHRGTAKALPSRELSV